MDIPHLGPQTPRMTQDACVSPGWARAWDCSAHRPNQTPPPQQRHTPLATSERSPWQLQHKSLPTAGSFGSCNEVLDSLEEDSSGAGGLHVSNWLLPSLGAPNYDANVKRSIWPADLKGHHLKCPQCALSCSSTDSAAWAGLLGRGPLLLCLRRFVPNSACPP